MKNLLRYLFILTIFALPLEVYSQTPASHTSKKDLRQIAMPFSESSPSGTFGSATRNSSFPSDPLSSLISVPGATSLGISGKWYLQGVHGLHNIQVDPDNPMNVHAIIQTALGVTTDTSTANFFPTRNVYYTFSADGGATWKTPKALGLFRAGYPDMVLFKHNGKYLPIIADHHFTSKSVTDLFCSVYVESGNPGDGNFVVGDCDRTTFNGSTNDIIWPIITVSNDGKKVYIIASVSPPTGTSTYDYIQFGSFDLSAESAAPSNWSGWQSGPGAGSSQGLSVGQTYALRISPKGKLGITWQSYDLTTPDYGLYLAESTDNGKTWTDPKSVFATLPTAFPNVTDASFKGDPAFYLHAGDGIDMYYDGEDATVMFGADVSTVNFATGDNYSNYPSSGTLLYWRPSMSMPQILVSKVSAALSPLAPAIDTGAYLSVYLNGTQTDPQMPNLVNPTIARTAFPKIWSIFFEAWAHNDSAQYTAVASDGSDTLVYLPFHSIYRITTTDNGGTWASAPIIENDMATPVSKHNDYRYPEASTWNPVVNGQLQNYVLFDADTAAGNWLNPPGPGFDNVGFFFKKDLQSVSSVKTTIAPGVVDLSQNYPNPFSSSTTIPVMMKNDDIVTITVSDMLGREIAVVYHGMLSAGGHQIPFTAPNAGAGIYTYTLKTSAGSISRTMSLVK